MKNKKIFYIIAIFIAIIAVSILLPKDEQIREETLITCTNGNKERLILKAKEI